MSKSVVYDVNVLVNAAPAKGGDPLNWPALPPHTGNGPRDAIGAINARREFVLWLSPHILRNTRRVLVEKRMADPIDTERYIEVLEELAVNSGGGVVDPPRTVHDNRDHEDNLILDLAAAVDADLIVSSDKDLVDMKVWRGRPLIRPDDFAKRVDAAWRHQPRTTAPTTADLLRRRKEKATAEAVTLHRDSTVLKPGTLEIYGSLRSEFDSHSKRLGEIVSGWNPHNADTQKRIALWDKNLAVAAEQAAKIDALAKSTPDIACDAISTLNAKLDFALDKMDPRRQPQARSRAHLNVVNDSPPAPPSPQYGD
jgi:putative PIN family toxin of toxin-antitoxin system